MTRVFTDGASRGNPGNAAWAFVIVDDDNAIIKRDSGYIGHATNNDAEYMAIEYAIKALYQMGKYTASIYSDSEIVVRQLNGQYRCKEPRLQIKKAIIKDLEQFVIVGYYNVPRENAFIRECDRLCNVELNNHEEVSNEKGINIQNG